jgi:spore maturation protein SpmA
MNIALPLAGMMALWLGFLRLAELSGLVRLLARALQPLLGRLFPEIPAGHPALGSMVMNMAANMLGLGNAATPLGLRAMRDLETLNPTPGTATNAMCTFLAINTSSIQLIPSTAIAILAAQGSVQATAIVGPALLATTVSTIVGVCAVKLLQHWPAFRELPSTSGRDKPLPPPPATTNSAPGTPQPADSVETSTSPPAPITLGGKALLCLVIGSGILLAALMLVPSLLEPLWVPLRKAALISPDFPSKLVPPELQNQSGAPRAMGILSLLAVPYALAFFATYAAVRGVKVYEEFIQGAREGWEVALRIFPYLTAILVAVRMFREAGGVDLLSQALSPLLVPLGVSPELLPLILVRPLSGGATTALFSELVVKFGPDSLLARTAATIFGSTETTFYVLAVYFGAVGIRRGRHALAAGLLADAAGALAAILICRGMFA